MNLFQLRHLAALLMLAIACSGTARADLISLDSSFGPDTITLDTDTGLQWLDLTVTDNRSFNEVAGQLGAGGEFEGFRFATQAEVIELFMNAGIPDITTHAPPARPEDFTAANLQPAFNLGDLLGPTGATPGGYVAEGLTGTAPDGDDTLRIIGELNLCIVPLCVNLLPGVQNVALASVGPHRQGLDEVDSRVGSYLVLEAIPLPPAFLLLATAIAGLGVTRRRGA